MTKGSVTGAHVFWNGMPEALLNHFQKTVLFIETKFVKKQVHDMYNFQELFPKLAIDKDFGFKNIVVKEIENGYEIVEETKK
jgi:hypothetical protein